MNHKSAVCVVRETFLKQFLLNEFFMDHTPSHSILPQSYLPNKIPPNLPIKLRPSAGVPSHPSSALSHILD